MSYPTNHEVLTLDDLDTRPRVAEKLPDAVIVDIFGRWANNLESGQFAQGRQCLRSKRPDANDDRWCCLGVLIETAIQAGHYRGEWEESADQGSWYEVEGHLGLLPDALVDMLGLGDDGSHPNGWRWYSPHANQYFDQMTTANDNLRLSFPAIASAVRYEMTRLERGQTVNENHS